VVDDVLRLHLENLGDVGDTLVHLHRILAIGSPPPSSLSFSCCRDAMVARLDAWAMERCQFGHVRT
jgi:hypothetical protein